MNETASHASIYRIARREALRNELGQKLGQIERSTHAVVSRHGKQTVYSYGTRTECEAFVDGIERTVRVVKFDGDMKEVQAAHKVRVYRGQGA